MPTSRLSQKGTIVKGEGIHGLPIESIFDRYTLGQKRKQIG